MILLHRFTPTADGTCALCVGTAAQHASEQARLDAEQHSRIEEFRQRTDALGGDSIAASLSIALDAMFPQRKERA